MKMAAFFCNTFTPPTMNIALLTDLHLDLKNPVHESRDTVRQFQDTLAAVKDWDPDHIVVLGDLAMQRGGIDIYKSVQASLGDVQIPFDIISGNHDLSHEISEVFYASNTLSKDGEHYFASSIKDMPAIFLDSSSGHISENQLAWFKDRLTMINDKVFIFIHHPILDTNSIAMERLYPLSNRAELANLLTTYVDKTFYIFCGHYHKECVTFKDNIVQYLTPSTWVQIGDESDEITILQEPPGFRKLIIRSEILISFVKYNYS
jgi:Icc protein